MRNFLFAIAVGVVAGCASSSIVMTGTARDPIAPEQVEMLSSMPEDCEVLGFINASSDSGFTEQQCYDYAVAELKSRAAAIGANAVVVENVGAANTGYVGTINHGNLYMVPNERHFVSGKAIYYKK